MFLLSFLEACLVGLLIRLLGLLVDIASIEHGCARGCCEVCHCFEMGFVERREEGGSRCSGRRGGRLRAGGQLPL
ncbi:hypothetical protein BKA65DRAFT_155190 [Rhexocercosporidium sp. MPI-PUGE-AT-0058]|nr:hypothetical protein BKA65DRAFT_155190 [Rhexocercosporidium sp. MPI-PUGE-AT-0058]